MPSYFSLVWGQLELDFIGAKGAYNSLFVLCTVSTVTKKSKWVVFILLLLFIAQVHKHIPEIKEQMRVSDLHVLTLKLHWNFSL